MKTKLNLALIPINLSDKFIKLSQSLSEFADRYSLGTGSLPHVTLRQFYVEGESVKKTWESLKHITKQSIIKLKFTVISYVTFDNIIYWVSLTPNNHNILNKLHVDACKVLGMEINSSYDPHLTLINSQNNHLEINAREILSEFSCLEDKFILSLGNCDEIGQFTNVLYMNYQHL